MNVEISFRRGSGRKIPFLCQFFGHKFKVVRSGELFNLGISFKAFCQRPGCGCHETVRFPPMPNTQDLTTTEINVIRGGGH